ncbi:MAG: response regulator [Chloroflexota bacterium]
MHKILIVDDEEHTRTLFSKLLRKENYELLFAVDGEEGLQLAERESPSCIILDYQMPILNGADMLRRLRATDWGAHIPVIFVTASSQTQMLSDLEDESVVLLKPIDTQLLLGHAQRLIANNTAPSA